MKATSADSSFGDSPSFELFESGGVKEVTSWTPWMSSLFFFFLGLTSGSWTSSFFLSLFGSLSSGKESLRLGEFLGLGEELGEGESGEGDSSPDEPKLGVFLSLTVYVSDWFVVSSGIISVRSVVLLRRNKGPSPIKINQIN